MKMELSRRDRMLLLGLGVIVIVLVGIFVFIKPKYEEIQTHQATYEETKTTWDGIDQKIESIPSIETNITELYKSALSDAQLFVNTAFVTENADMVSGKTSMEIDQYLQNIITENELELEISALTLAEASTSTLSYYYYTPNVLTYALLESADINGNYADKAASAVNVETVVSGYDTVDLMTATVSISLSATKEQIMAFLQAISEDKNAVLITAFDISNYAFTDGLEIDEEGNFIGEDGMSSCTVSLSFYNAYTIDEPDFSY